MKELKIYLLLVGIALSQVLSAQEAANSIVSLIPDTIPFDFTEYNNIAINAVLNNEDTTRLMFHTAASDLSLTQDATRRLGNISWGDKVGGVKSWGGSSGESRVSTNNTMKIGNTQLDSLTIWENKNSGHTTDGKFGPNFFEAKHIEINFDASIIVVHNALPIKAKDYYKLPIKFENGFMFVEATSNIGAEQIKNQFLLHSGYSGMILFDDKFVEENDISDHVEITGERNLTDSAGNVMIEKKALLPRFLFGDTEFQDIPVGFFEGAIGRQKMSVIGGDLLKRFNIIIDANRENLYIKSNTLNSFAFFGD